MLDSSSNKSEQKQSVNPKSFNLSENYYENRSERLAKKLNSLTQISTD